MILDRLLSKQGSLVGMVLLGACVAGWCTLQPHIEPTLFFYVRLVLGLLCYAFVIYGVIRWKMEGLAADLIALTTLLMVWGALYPIGSGFFPYYFYQVFGLAIGVSIVLGFWFMRWKEKEDTALVVWGDPWMTKQGNPALEGYLWSQDYGCLLDWLDDDRIAIVTVGDGKGVDPIFYLRKVRNGDQEEYRAWNRHECLTVWSSGQHDGRIFSDRCEELQVRFLM